MPAIDAQRLQADLAQLATYSSAPPSPLGTAVTRILFTPEDLAARAWLLEQATQARLETRTDPAGNLFLRLPGTNPRLAPVATGSHIDAIPHAGMYDGTVGVLAGLEALRTLARTGPHPRSIELIVFTAEEPTRFGIGCLGSRILTGSLPAAEADALPDSLNPSQTLREVRTQAGYPGDLVPLQPGAYAAFLELHIEQGPLLERERLQIGLVTSIAAPASYRFSVEGFGGHAGALLMPDRRDALCAAAELILAIEDAALTQGTLDTVATVGLCDVHPGAINSVPSRVALTLDLRDTDPARRGRVLAAIRSRIAAIELARGVRIAETLINADQPATCDPKLIELLFEEARQAGFTTRPMVSRAYHDTLFMARLCPVAMIFIPCRAGVSHRPDELATPDDIARGTALLTCALAKLASE